MGLIFVFALLGLVIGGLRGFVIGAALGYAILWGLKAALKSGARVAQSSFLDVSFSVMGALCKADGVVTSDEIRTAEHFFDLLHLANTQRESLKAAFSRGKQPDFDLDAEIDRLGAIRFGRGPLLRLFLQIQVMAVAADGQVHPAEHAMLVRIARRLGLTERDVAQLEALLRAAAAGPAGATGAGRPAPQARLEDAYTALGLSKDASVAEIKRAYRRLVSENHPDKLAARGLPDSMRELAEERTRELNVAYDLIKEARKFS